MNEQSDRYTANVNQYINNPIPGQIYEVLIPYDTKAQEAEMELLDKTEVRGLFI